MERTVGVLLGGERVDSFLTEVFQKDSLFVSCSRSQIKHLIKTGSVKINGMRCGKGGEKVRKGDIIQIKGGNFARERSESWDFPLDIVFEDEFILVVNKPAGIVMHPGAGNKDKTLLNALFNYLSPKDSEGFFKMRGGIVHRLDKGTSGLIVVAKNIQSHSALAKQFKDRTVSKRYLAVVYNTPKGTGLLERGVMAGKIELMVGRHPFDPTKMGIVKKGGREAVTYWKVVERHSWGALLECRPLTGRTHQIRVHLSYAGNPILGDLVYGKGLFNNLPSSVQRAAKELNRLALHACGLEFIHPVGINKVSFFVGLPKELKDLLTGIKTCRA